MIMLSLCSFKRGDLAVELFVALVSDRLTRAPVAVEGVKDARTFDREENKLICTACFADPYRSLAFSRVMLSFRELALPTVRTCCEDRAALAGRKCCECGHSMLTFRVAGDPKLGADPKAAVTIAACAKYIIYRWKQGCAKNNWVFV
jgi:hypothetical protein